MITIVQARKLKEAGIPWDQFKKVWDEKYDILDTVICSCDYTDRYPCPDEKEMLEFIKEKYFLKWNIEANIWQIWENKCEIDSESNLICMNKDMTECLISAIEVMKWKEQ